MKIKAYAKINLSLAVKGILPNGYHDLFMVNSRIDLFDTISIKKSKKERFVMNKDLCPVEKNIGYKAMLLVKEKFNIDNNYSIYITKRIPSGAGLGGGSADAAAIIQGILKLENIAYHNEDLIDIATKLGADVPYCLYKEKCIVTGIGEKIQKIDLKKEYLVLLASPALSFSTKQIFDNYKQTQAEANIEALLSHIKEPTKYLFNDLELAVKELYPEYKLDEIKSEMNEHGAVASLMTGSGSSIYGLFELTDKSKIKDCMKSIKNKWPDISLTIIKTISTWIKNR